MSRRAVAAVGGPWLASAQLWRDDRRPTSCGQRLDKPLVGIDRYIGGESVGFHAGQQVVVANEAAGPSSKAMGRGQRTGQS